MPFLLFHQCLQKKLTEKSDIELEQLFIVVALFKMADGAGIR